MVHRFLYHLRTPSSQPFRIRTPIQIVYGKIVLLPLPHRHSLCIMAFHSLILCAEEFFMCVSHWNHLFQKRIMCFVQTWMILMDAPEGSTKAVGRFHSIALYYVYVLLCALCLFVQRNLRHSLHRIIIISQRANITPHKSHSDIKSYLTLGIMVAFPV